MLTDTRLRIAIPSKGRLQERALELLATDVDPTVVVHVPELPGRRPWPRFLRRGGAGLGKGDGEREGIGRVWATVRESRIPGGRCPPFRRDR